MNIRPDLVNHNKSRAIRTIIGLSATIKMVHELISDDSTEGADIPKLFTELLEFAADNTTNRDWEVSCVNKEG